MGATTDSQAGFSRHRARSCRQAGGASPKMPGREDPDRTSRQLYQRLLSRPAREKALNELGIRPAAKQILCFGMIRPYKGVPSLLRTWQKIAPKDAQLLIAGTAEPRYREQLTPLIQDAEKVIWHDQWISNERLPIYFSVADAVVFPFEKILTSASVMLAMGYGKPIIAPKLGEIPETLADADDFTYSPDDPTGLERCLRRALESDLDELAAHVGCGETV